MNEQFVDSQVLEDWRQAVDMVSVRVCRYHEINMVRSVAATHVLDQLVSYADKSTVDYDNHPSALVSESKGDGIAALFLASHLEEIYLVQTPTPPLD
jgi:hypothetical protein